MRFKRRRKRPLLGTCKLPLTAWRWEKELDMQGFERGCTSMFVVLSTYVLRHMQMYTTHTHTRS